MAETFFYLTTTGRSTGTPHKIEIWFVEYAGCYYLCSEKRDHADWVKNIQQQPSITYYIATQDDPIPNSPLSGIAQPLDENSDILALVKSQFDKKYNWSDGLLIQICADA